MQKADCKYRDQLVGAYRFLQDAVRCVIGVDEVLDRPGAQPLRDLLENPRFQQLQEAASAREALLLVTLFCCEEAIVLQQVPDCGWLSQLLPEAPVPATEDALREREQDLQAREAELLKREAAIGAQEQRIQ